MFDDIAASVASSLSGVFGADCTYTRGVEFSETVRAVIRRDIEALDETGQVIGRINTVRLAAADVTFTPMRGDTVDDGRDVFTIGRRIADDRYAFLYEATA